MNIIFTLHFCFMTLPFFYKEDINASATDVMLDEVTSKHIVQVLRMQNGEQLQLTNGKGDLFTAAITDNNRKKCTVKILQTTNHIPQIYTPELQLGRATNICIAISLLKNSSRFEWFLEKATEIGVTEINPLLCSRTEKTTLNSDRMKSILLSAMLQSRQCHLPILHEPVKFTQVILSAAHQQKFIAHCIDEEKRNLSDLNNESLSSKIILIGPEGDFTKEEVELALQHHFIAVTLGHTRLRTETAGIVAATLLRHI